MKICLTCKGEYLDQIENCGICNVSLVTEEEALMAPSDDMMSPEEFFDSEVLPFLEGGITHCREVEKVLKAAKVPCAVYPISMKEEEVDNAAAMYGVRDKKYMLLIRPEDLENAKKAMEGQFHRAVAKEGQGVLNNEIINLEAEAISCPACGETAPLNNGECVNCGLFLGEPENEQQKVG